MSNVSAEEFDRLTDEYIYAVKEHRIAHGEFMADIRDNDKKSRYEAATAEVMRTGGRWNDAWRSPR
jgi:hypothetical protein